MISFALLSVVCLVVGVNTIQIDEAKCEDHLKGYIDNYLCYSKEDAIACFEYDDHYTTSCLDKCYEKVTPGERNPRKFLDELCIDEDKVKETTKLICDEYRNSNISLCEIDYYQLMEDQERSSESESAIQDEIISDEVSDCIYPFQTDMIFCFVELKWDVTFVTHESNEEWDEKKKK